MPGMDVKRGALMAAILGSTVVAVDATVVNVALPTIADDLGGGLAGQQWVANAYLLTLSSLILVSGSLSDLYGERRVFTLGVAGFGVTSLLCALAPTVELLVVAPRAAGRLGRAAHPGVAGDHRRGVPRVGAGCRDRVVDGVGRDRLPDRPAHRRPDRRQRVVALGVRDQRAARAGHARAVVALRAGGARAGRGAAEARRGRRAALRARSRGHLVRADRAAGARLVGPRGLRAARRRRPDVRGVRRLRAAHARADAPARAVQAAQLHGRQHRDAARCTAAWRCRASSSCCSCSRSRASARWRPARRAWSRRS